jgi:hypothetical protein
MLVSVNKTTVARKPVTYAALASGTISHVWSEEEPKAEKRQVRVTIKTERHNPRDAQ